MSDEKRESQNEDLKAFEAALGSLRPRTDRLDPSWRAELAKQAAAPGPLSGHQPKVGRKRAASGPLSLWERARVRAFGAGKTPACPNPSGHRFLCIYCGSEAAPVRGAGRWAWPAALSAMTAAAAILLAMLVTRWQLPITGPAGKQGTVTPAPLLAQYQASPAAAENGRGPEYRSATEDSPRPAYGPGGEATSYLALRDQVLRDGVESWKFPVSPAVATVRTKDAAEGPQSYREQLNRLLEQQGLRGS